MNFDFAEDEDAWEKLGKRETTGLEAKVEAIKNRKPSLGAQVGMGLVRGVDGALSSTADLVGLGWDPLFGEGKYGVEKFVAGTAEFFTGFGPAFKALSYSKKAAKLFSKAGKLAGFVKGATAGAIADFAVWDGHEERLSNLIESNPDLANPITAFLSADPEDGKAEARLKNSLEGLLLGGVSESALKGAQKAIGGLVKGVKAIKKGRLAKEAGATPDELDAIADQTIREVVPYDPKAAGPTQTLLPPTVDRIVPDAQLSPSKVKEFGELEGEVKKFLKENDENLVISPRRGDPVRLETVSIDPKDLNLSWMPNFNARSVAFTLMKVHDEAVRKSLTGIEPQRMAEIFETGIRRLSETASIDPKKLKADLFSDAKNLDSSLEAATARVLNTQLAAHTMAVHLAAANKAILSKSAADLSDREIASVLYAHNNATDYSAALRNARARAGRLLAASKFKAKNPKTDSPDLFKALTYMDEAEVKHYLDAHGGRDAVLKRVRDHASLNDNLDFPVLPVESGSAKFWRVTKEYWYGAVLGPTSFAGSVLGNTIGTLGRPLSVMAGAAPLGKWGIVRQAADEIAGLVTATGEAWRMTKLNYRNGGGQILGGVAPRQPAIQAATWNMRESDRASRFAGLVDGLGSVIRFFPEAMTAQDEGFRQLNYRSIARAQFLAEGRAKGLADDALGDFVDTGMADVIRDGQAVTRTKLYDDGVRGAKQSGLTDPDDIHASATRYADQAWDAYGSKYSALRERAMQAGEDAALMNPLVNDSFSGKLQKFVNSVPWMFMVLPFIKVQANVLRWTGNHLPNPKNLWKITRLKPLEDGKYPSLKESHSRFLRDMTSNDPMRQAEARGRYVLGFGTAMTVMAAVTSGKITGRGPTDPDTRRSLEQTGWQPYSFKIGDKYVSYSRLDPVATLIGTIADTVAYSDWVDTRDQSLVSTLFHSAVYALTNNFTQKSYVEGIRRTVEGLQSDRKMETLVSSTLGAFLPASFNAAAKTVDPYQRDINNLSEFISNRIPFYSKTLMPIRDMLGNKVERAKAIGGETIPVFNAFLPIAYRSVKDDTIYQEVAALQHPFLPPSREKDGQDLVGIVDASGQTAYDRWQELHGRVTIKGLKLENALRKLIKSRDYQAMTAESNDEFDSPRVAAIRGVIRQYRQEAWEQTLKEYPELRKASATHRRTRAQLKRGALSL